MARAPGTAWQEHLAQSGMEREITRADDKPKLRRKSEIGDSPVKRKEKMEGE